MQRFADMTLNNRAHEGIKTKKIDTLCEESRKVGQGKKQGGKKRGGRVGEEGKGDICTYDRAFDHLVQAEANPRDSRRVSRVGVRSSDGVD